jgi:hypothetical protein
VDLAQNFKSSLLPILKKLKTLASICAHTTNDENPTRQTLLMLDCATFFYAYKFLEM